MSMHNVKYTKEMLLPIVKESVSLSEVLRKMGKRCDGNTWSYLSKTIKKFKIDTSHFLGKRANSGANHKGGCQKKHWSSILVAGGKDRRETPYVLRRALLEFGREYKCEKCNNAGTWQDEELILQVEHKNGDWSDNRPENLCFYCPNCHSQATKKMFHKGKTGIISCKTYVYKPSKNNPEQKNANSNWRELAKINQRRVYRPSLQELENDVTKLGYCGTGRKYGVSDNAIRKWIRMYNKYGSNYGII